MAKVTIDNLASAVMEILDKYADDVNNVSEEAVKKVTKAGAQALKGNPGGFGGSGKYSSGWTTQFETGRLSTQGTIYNGKTPGLPHLLEKGHAKRGGGRTAGRAHIAPVEQEIIKSFEEAIEQGVSGI